MLTVNVEEELDKLCSRRAQWGGRALWAVMTHCFSLVGSEIWHLELIQYSAMATSSCGIVNTLKDWKEERESGFRCFSTMKSGAPKEAAGASCAHVLRSHTQKKKR